MMGPVGDRWGPRGAQKRQTPQPPLHKPSFEPRTSQDTGSHSILPTPTPLVPPYSGRGWHTIRGSAALQLVPFRPGLCAGSTVPGPAVIPVSLVTWQRGGPPTPSQRAAHPGPSWNYATAGAGGVLGSSWGTGRRPHLSLEWWQKDDARRGRNVIQEVKVLFRDPEVLPSPRVTLGVSPGRRPPPGTAEARAPRRGHRREGRTQRRGPGGPPSAPRGASPDPRQTQARRPPLPARRRCGSARPPRALSCGSAAGATGSPQTTLGEEPLTLSPHFLMKSASGL